MAPSLNALTVIAFVCEALLYGAYIVLFAASLYVLFSTFKAARNFNVVIVTLHCLLFVACTVHFAVGFARFHHHLKAGTLEHFGDTDHLAELAGCLVAIANFLGDSILIYRCWIIWNQRMYIPVLPSVLATSALVCAVTVTGLVWDRSGRLVANRAETSTIMSLERASFVLPLCTNVITTALILSRIWWVSRAIGGSSTTRRAIHVIIESGSLYFLVQIMLVILYGIQSGGATIMISIAVQTYGIASTLIIIHVGLGLSSVSPATSTSLPQMQFSTIGVTNRTALGSPVETFELRVRRPSNAHHEDSFGPTRGTNERIATSEEHTSTTHVDYKKAE